MEGQENTRKFDQLNIVEKRDLYMLFEIAIFPLVYEGDGSKCSFYDKQGNRISMVEWGDYAYSSNYINVKEEFVGEIFISTFWLGIDKNCLINDDPNYKPFIFKTCVLDTKNITPDFQKKVYTDYYRTLEDAEAGHKKLCEEVKDAKYRWITP